MKVWILEGFVTREHMEDNLAKQKAMREDVLKDENSKHLVEVANMLVETTEKLLAEHPDGYWMGYQGKVNYREFCYCARQTMETLKEMQFRVVQAEISDKAKTWAGYKNPKVNEGVFKYLMATA